ncbi:MAG: hypothetical protein J6I64_07745 [Lachnospiraceae bacterium]|nr:hypothetical protein [Lachnospiraceae bacterium]
MSDSKNVIQDRGVGAERMLDIISTVSDESLELALDTDTREKYEALAEKKLSADQPIHIKIFKAIGTVAACFLCVLMLFSGMSRTSDYIPDGDGNSSGKPSEEIVHRVWYDDVWYQSVTDPTVLQEHGLPETVTEDVTGGMVTYLARSGEYEYHDVGHMTSLYLYSCKGREDVYILHDENKALWMFVIPVEE